MAPTRHEWLDGLGWHEGTPPPPAPPEDPIYGTRRKPSAPCLRVAPGMVYRLRNGMAVIVGDINGFGGTCGC